MLILTVKTLHILGVVLFLGTGLGSAWYKLRAGRSRDAAIAAWCDAEVVFADWVFTVPSGVAVPATGLWLVYLYGLPLATPWVWQGIAGYCIAGATWLPAAVLQIRMRRLSARAAADGTLLPEDWYRMQKIWTLLGLPSFGATLAVVWMMVTKMGIF
jgi:uncharacterized membrane protein